LFKNATKVNIFEQKKGFELSAVQFFLENPGKICICMNMSNI